MKFPALLKAIQTVAFCGILLTGCDQNTHAQLPGHQSEAPQNSQTPTSQKLLPVVTLNTYWFMDPESTPGERGDPPKTPQEKAVKVANLAKLILTSTQRNQPWIIAVQEIGTKKDLQELADALETIGADKLIPLFVKGRDSFTGQNTGFLLNPSYGWKVRGQANRPADLQKEISKHISLALEKGDHIIMITNVHLRVPKDPEAKIAHQSQMEALLRYTMRHLQNPNANIIILGDFNDPSPPGRPGTLEILTKNSGLIDTSVLAPETERKTHQKINKMLDRILVSPAIYNGTNGLRMQNQINIVFHQMDPKTATDHFPVSLFLKETY